MQHIVQIVSHMKLSMWSDEMYVSWQTFVYNKKITFICRFIVLKFLDFVGMYCIYCVLNCALYDARVVSSVMYWAELNENKLQIMDCTWRTIEC